ncbi:class I SAM-dependent methyltransferase [Sedimentitalea todarodis]|uniref:Class I SAM-dependent methyltransferase n=1 Tax=Sedimentitalea todarodis TaxID=1631240 RepID=A0ABU3VL46_9RHOB|nr:class I SAM-dependent methyltransferase [Sedimentitalea todarodis]MDU9006908.1 class I SAM-dependent methyltransferase [Sedimentitalea todarodis]
MKIEHQETRNHDIDRLAMYREIQRAVPGLDTIYRLALSLVADQPSANPRVLIVGAGGGREIETFATEAPRATITAVDPSAENLAMARRVVGPGTSVQFVEGLVEDLLPDENFDVATSLLVMHHIADDGAKLAYLRAIRARLAAGGLLIHADICHDVPEEFERLVPIYKAHARHVGATADATQLELQAIPTLPLVTSNRIHELLEQAGFAAPTEVFRSLWYRCWVSAPASKGNPATPPATPGGGQDIANS